jgi:hypothetical protein
MIILYRKKESEKADEIRRKLDELVLAYQTRLLPEDAEKPFYIRDGGKEISTGEIENWLLILEKELFWQRSLSGDGCFIDPETGEIC